MGSHPCKHASTHNAHTRARTSALGFGPVDEITVVARHTLRGALFRACSTGGPCPVAARALLVCAAHSITRASARLLLHLADFVAIGVRLAGVLRREEETGRLAFHALRGTVFGARTAGGPHSIFAHALLV